MNDSVSAAKHTHEYEASAKGIKCSCFSKSNRFSVGLTVG